METTTDASALTPHALTQELARANKLSLDSLDANHAGHLSSQQMKVVLETFGFALVLPVVFLGLIVACGAGFFALQHGFSDQNTGDLAQGGVLLVIGALLLIGVGLLINQIKRTGTDKYLSQRRIFQLFLMPIDLIRGQVASVEGSTTPEVATITQRERGNIDYDPTATHHYYSYRVAGTEFEVSEESYNAFPKSGVRCRIYYLPLSKALLNVEVMDTAPLNVQMADSPESETQTPDAIPAPDRRKAQAELRLESIDAAVVRPLGTLAARLALGNSQASEIESRLSHPRRSMSTDITSSPIYTQALQIAGADSRVLAELGEPIKPLPGVTGSTQSKNNVVVMADLVIPISGARKRGKLYVTARQNDGMWEFSRLEVKVDGNADVMPLGY
jgi:Cytochrome oxidase complex assembly protein 1